MLHPVEDVAAALAGLGQPGPADFTFRNFSRRANAVLFTHSSSGALAALNGADLMLLAGSSESRLQVMTDLFTGSFAPGSPWPDEHASKAWQREGSQFIFCNSSPLAVWEAGLEAGFLKPDNYEHKHYANLYWFEGRPRFRHLIEHSCRLGRGMELYDLLRSGIGYDEDGYYTRTVLSEKPSFVCEAQGQPVCWSTIHLNGTMGMIFTPPEHRRHGYARSLACFQIDHELRRQRFACCHVNNENLASSGMLMELGATKDDTPLGWRPLHWPGGTCPYSV